MNKLLNQLLILAIGLPVNDETQSDRLQIIKNNHNQEILDLLNYYKAK